MAPALVPVMQLPIPPLTTTFDTTTTLYLTLEDLEGEMEGVNLEIFEQVCSNFVASRTNGVDDVSCSVQNQVPLGGGPVEVEILISGVLQNPARDFGAVVFESFREGSNLFINALQEASDFFDTLFRRMFSLERNTRLATTLYIVLEDVEGELDNDETESLAIFERVCGEFLAPRTNRVDDLTCSVRDQVRLEPSSETGPLQLEVVISGEVGENFSGDFGAIIFEGFREGSNLFVTALNESSDVFSTVVRRSFSFDPQEVAPQQGDAGDTNEIFGLARNIVIAIAAGLGVCLLSIILLCTCGRGRPPTRSAL